MAIKFMAYSLLAIGLMYSLYPESKLTLSSSYQPPVSWLIILLSIHVCCLTKGFSVFTVVKSICRNVENSGPMCWYACCNGFVYLIRSCFIINFITIAWVIVYPNGSSINTHTFQIIEQISVAMIFIIFLILCDHLSHGYVHMMVFFKLNYPAKLWLLWQSFIIIIVVSHAGNLDLLFCLLTLTTCHHHNQHSYIYALVVALFIVICICKFLFDIDYGNRKSLNFDAESQPNLQPNINHDNNNISESLELPLIAQNTNDKLMNDTTKQLIIYAFRYISTILIIVNAVITATATMSLYFVIEHHINKLEKNYPFVKYNQQLTRSPTMPTRFSTPKPTIHHTRPTEYPTTSKPTARPINNVSHVKYISEPYKTLQTYENEQLFCWIAFFVAISVIVVVLHSRITFPPVGMFFFLFVLCVDFLN